MSASSLSVKWTGLTLHPILICSPNCLTSEGGLFWFENLTIRDDTYALPAINLGVMMVNLQIAFGRANSTFMKIFHRGLLLLLAATFPIVSQFPAGVFTYWISNSTLSLLQGFILRRPAVRKFLMAGVKVPPRQLSALARPTGATNPTTSTAGEMQLIQEIVKSYTEENQDRSDSEKRDPEVVIREINAALAAEKKSGTLKASAMVMLRKDPERETEPEVVVYVVSEEDQRVEKEKIGLLVDELITKHGDPTGGNAQENEGKDAGVEPDEAVLAAINASLTSAFEKGLIATPAQAKLVPHPKGGWALSIDMGL